MPVERKNRVNIFKQIGKTDLFFRSGTDKDCMSLDEYNAIKSRYRTNIDKIYAAYLLGYSRGRKRGVRHANTERFNHVTG